ncbi:MAG: hypothetical protein GY842_22820 [bacterium]|nr:hypothetical protein [bacterium]
MSTSSGMGSQTCSVPVSSVSSVSKRVKSVSGNRLKAWAARVVLIVLFVLLLASTACEVLTHERTDFPEAMVAADGSEIILDDVAAIVSDGSLNAESKRQALRDLGIEDEDLLDALLAG